MTALIQEHHDIAGSRFWIVSPCHTHDGQTILGTSTTVVRVGCDMIDLEEERTPRRRRCGRRAASGPECIPLGGEIRP
jgi:hypothetical protein